MPEHRFLDASLDFDERTRALLDELTLEEKIGLLTTHMNPVPRLGIKEFWIGAEVARGLVCRDDKNGEAPTTVFPEPFGLAATFDTDIMRRMGEITGIETRIYRNKDRASLCVWGPTVDLERDPRWGRTEEGYGEDPCLVGTLAAAFTSGMAGNDEKYRRVIPTLKHFYADNNEEERVSCNVSIPTRLKHEYYLRAFEKPIREGRAGSLMTAYNEVNGVEQIVSKELQKFCRDQWGLLFAVTDGGDFIQNVQFHRRDKTHTEAFAKIYSNNGADILTDNEELVRSSAREALQKGLISEKDLDRALSGALKARFMLGEFDAQTPFDSYPEELLCSDEHYKAAEKAAEESVILLRNSRGVLPLSKDSRLAVIGYHADMNFRDWYTGLSPKCNTILDVLTAEVGRENLIYENGNDIIALRNDKDGFYFSVSEEGTVRCDCPIINETCLFELFEWGDGAVSLRSKFNNKFLADAGREMMCTSEQPYGWFVKELFYIERNGRDCVFRNWQKRFLYINPERGISVTTALKPPATGIFNIELFSDGTERVRRVSTEAHQTVVFCGNNPMVNARETIDRNHLKLPEKQQRNLDAALEMNPDAVLYLVSGYPYELEKKHSSTVMHICHAGPALGTAVTRTLFGDVSPAGRCPVTWYKSAGELCDIKDYNIMRTRSTYLYYDGEPLYPFGHGLSYTAFRYSAIRPEKLSYGRGETVKVSFDLENVGRMDGDEVVQLYVSSPNLPLTAPKMQLKAFKRVSVPRGDSVTVELSFNVDELSFWSVTKDDFELYSGNYTLHLGGSSAEIRRTCEIQVNGAVCEGMEVSEMIPAVSALDYTGVLFDADEKLDEYALIKDWQSVLSFEYCRMRGYHNVEIIVSNPGDKATLTISCGENCKTVAVLEVPPTSSLTEFVRVRANAEPVDGVFTLKMTTSGMLSLKSFRFS
ncbi:MAG: glycoside hydrolase family 3 C-terminal domain-containing protein [Oscillospiraceae bacterium]